FAELSSINEDTDNPSAIEVITRLVDGQDAVVRTARSLSARVGDVSVEFVTRVAPFASLFGPELI
ncbi:MAG: hypothetical protein EB062_04865, partial [Actinobacteria bacterium]|nr:hypothetical protein [Actinomycetota bacterium]